MTTPEPKVLTDWSYCCSEIASKAGWERIPKELTGFEVPRIALQNGVTENLHT